MWRFEDDETRSARTLRAHAIRASGDREFDPQTRDENVDYYIAKLDELVKKFGGVGAVSAKSDAKQESLAC